MLDVIIVGAGPAGLSAALILARCRRRVLVLDAGRPRNARSEALHGFLSRDGIAPAEFLKAGREQLERYETVQLLDAEVVNVCRGEGRFDVTTADGATHASRMLLLATGVVDELPDLPGLEDFYGRGVHHCPYCDGWEVRDRPLAAYGEGKRGYRLALELRPWSRQVVVCSHGPAELDAEERERLARHGIALREERIVRLEGSDGRLERIVFESGDPLPCRAFFFSTRQLQHSPLPEQLGCDFNERGAVDTGTYETTNVPGVFVAGDAAREVQLAIVAAAEGAKAAFAINVALTKADLG